MKIRKVFLSTIFSIAILFTVLIGTASAISTILCFNPQGGYDANFDRQITNYNYRVVGQKLLSDMCEYLICPPNLYLFENETAGNALAAKIGDLYKVVYNPDFMSDIADNFGDFAVIGILAHEMGHINDFHFDYNFNIGDYLYAPQIQLEATADMYAGCAFALAGESGVNLLPLAQALNSMGESGPGYPNLNQRINLIGAGYRQCEMIRDNDLGSDNLPVLPNVEFEDMESMWAD